MTPRQTNGLRVLVVEDDDFIAASLSDELKGRGLSVVGPARDGEGALQLVATQPVDFAVLDIDLDGATVFPVATALRDAAIPFIFATGYDPGLIPPRFRDVPLHAKPFRAEHLADAALSSGLERRRALVPSDIRRSNRLLRLLPDEDVAAMLPHALRVAPVEGGPEAIAGRVIFPEKGFCSLSLMGGAGVTLAMVGAESAVGEPITHDGEPFCLSARWQAGSEYVTVPSAVMAEILTRSPRARRLVAQNRLAFVVQMAWTSEAHATLTIAESLARWIVMAHDRLDGEIRVTHEDLARALGVRRAGVTTALHVLEGERSLNATRGRIRVLDRDVLARMAGPSYERIAGTERPKAAPPADTRRLN